MDLNIHAINLRPAAIERTEQDFKPKHKIRFIGLSVKSITKNPRLRGDEAMEVSARGRQDHLFFTSDQPPSYPRQQHSPILRRTNLSPIKKILQPDLVASLQMPRPHNLRLRGTESREIWKRSCGTRLPFEKPLLDNSVTIHLPTTNLKSQCQNEEWFLHERFPRQNFIKQYSVSDDVKLKTEGAREMFMRDHGRITDSIGNVLNQGWSENTGIRRIQPTSDMRRSKALTPYSDIDNVASIWDSNVKYVESKASLINTYKGLPSKDLHHSQGVAAALCSNQNSPIDIHQAHPRVRFEGIEIAKKNKGSVLFCDSTGTVNHSVTQKVIEKSNGDTVKHLLSNSKEIKILSPPSRQMSRIALRSRGGAAKACINPIHVKPKPSRAVRN